MQQIGVLLFWIYSCITKAKKQVSDPALHQIFADVSEVLPVEPQIPDRSVLSVCWMSDSK